MKVFISYSHKDSTVVERLKTHLAPLKREGLIDAWYDRDITAGSSLDDEIRRQLDASDLVLLIISPDFIASDYCFDIELRTAREKSARDELKIVPVIAEPCDWHGTLGDIKAVPKDGKAISDWVSQNTALLDVVQELRRIIERSKSAKPVSGAPTIKAQPPSNSYRVKKEFDDIDKAEFVEKSFSEIKHFFEQASSEIETLDGVRSKFTNVNEGEFQCLLVNRNVSSGRAYIAVRRKNGRGAIFGDIDFSYSENSSVNSSNGGFSIVADSFSLAFEGRMAFSAQDRRLTALEVAETLWKDFVGQAGIENA